MKVIVSCIGKFHAFALAEQLQKHNLLHTLFTTYAFQKNKLFRNLAKRIDHEIIDPSNIKTNILIAFGLKLKPLDFFWNNLFDIWVAWKIKRSNADVFIGWSGMSLRSIKAAQKKGMIAIVERGSSHILFQNNILKEEYKKFRKEFNIHPKIIETELKEYEEADYISIPSLYVQQTFTDRGFSKNKLVLNNYGSNFSIQEVIKEKSYLNKFTILYVGSLTVRKGLIYLFEALQNIDIPESEFEVHFIGTVADEMKETVKKFKKSNWIFIGQIEQSKLVQFITKASVAIQPSLEEGLSMVIPQILNCGVPVIATTNTGGEDLIVEGKNGFIVPIRNTNVIKEKIEYLWNNKMELSKMRLNTTQMKDLSWNDYGERYFDFLKTTKQ
jgi:glycosyltransferase involved in cell wall biosynthesis